MYFQALSDKLKVRIRVVLKKMQILLDAIMLLNAQVRVLYTVYGIPIRFFRKKCFFALRKWRPLVKNKRKTTNLWWFYILRRYENSLVVCFIKAFPNGPNIEKKKKTKYQRMQEQGSESNIRTNILTAIKRYAVQLSI